MFIKYEELKKEPHKTIKRIAGTEPLTEELVETVVEKSSFSNMLGDTSVNKRRKEGATVAIEYLRKGVIGDWKTHYTAQQNMDFEETIGRILKDNGVDFEYE